MVEITTFSSFRVISNEEQNNLTLVLKTWKNRACQCSSHLCSAGSSLPTIPAQETGLLAIGRGTDFLLDNLTVDRVVLNQVDDVIWLKIALEK